jgi:hypothetical protein
MRRRDFIASIGGATAWPLVAHGQQTARMRRIGVLMMYAEAGYPVNSGYMAVVDRIKSGAAVPNRERRFRG